MSTDPTPDKERIARRLDRSVRHRNELIEKLAKGDLTQYEIAKEFGVTQGTISNFKKKHLETIERLRAGTIDKMELLWVSDKAKRVAAYQSEVEHLDEQIDALRDEKIIDEYGMPAGDSEDLVRLYKRRDAALRSVAEELGQLPARLIIQSQRGVKLEIEGVSADGTPIADAV